MRSQANPADSRPDVKERQRPVEIGFEFEARIRYSNITQNLWPSATGRMFTHPNYATTTSQKLYLPITLVKTITSSPLVTRASKVETIILKRNTDFFCDHMISPDATATVSSQNGSFQPNHGTELSNIRSAQLCPAFWTTRRSENYFSNLEVLLRLG